VHGSMSGSSDRPRGEGLLPQESKGVHCRVVSGFPIFFSIFPYLFRIFPFYICVDILSVFFV